MQLQFHLEIASWSFYCRMAFLNFVYLGATTGGDSNSSYKLQEPACMPRKGTRPDPTSRTKGFGSQMNSFSLTLSACVDYNVMLRYHNTVTLSYYPRHTPCWRVPQGPKVLWTFRHVEKQCKSGHPCILSWAGCPPSRSPVHWLSHKRQRSGKRQRYMLQREQNTPDISA